MALEYKEDQTSPVSEESVKLVCSQDMGIDFFKRKLVELVLEPLNEKRDAYNGIITSMLYILKYDDPTTVKILKEGLQMLITNSPMRYGGKMFFSKALIRIIADRPQFIIDFFEEIIDSTPKWRKNFQEESEVLKLQIKALKAIKQAEQVDGVKPTKLSQEKIDQICIDAIYSCDDSTKIDTLSLVLESRSTTKPLDTKELNLFKVLFQDALSVQEPALRQNLLAVTNKTLRRLKESHRVVMRDKKRYTDDQRYSTQESYMKFLTWLVEFCFESIYCNAYFGSFLLTISSLKLVIQHVTFDDDLLKIEPLFCNKRCFDSVLGCLNDSFEENKKLALELLFMLPPREEFFCKENLDCFQSIAYQLVGSVNPAHSLTCQYIFKLVIGMAARQADRGVTKNEYLLHHLNQLTDLVEAGLKETNEDFVVALKRKPIYPKLSCIRALLSDVDISSLNEECRLEWQELAQRIVRNSISACRSVSEIVCNLNPETIGHLPMDLKPVDVETLSKTLKVSLKISDGKLNMISSQMLLISGWKTIKECSLALGAMVTLFWWPKQKIKAKLEKHRGLDMPPILCHDDIRMILDFFDHYLKNLRHRGAFEQAYNGFIMVTKRIWLDEDLRTMLTETLNQIVGDFKNEALEVQKAERLKAYVTRRSAGLPFYVQAILQSEHKQESKTLASVMDSLFEILESDSAEEYQKIHCLNILRALIKEHALGEKVLTYVGKTFAITMDAFKSDSYSIRNCASMLLKSAVDRAFGVNRLRGEIHRRNQLSYERFFTECPSLHTKMLGHLNEATLNKSSRSLATVHSIFIILFRLRPSLKPSPEFDIEKMVWPFHEPLIKLVHHCPDFKIRELAAKLIVRIETFIVGPDHPLSKSTLYHDKYLSGNWPPCLNLGRCFPPDWIQVESHLLLAINWIEQCEEKYFVKRVPWVGTFIWRILEIGETRGVEIPINVKTLTLDLVSTCCLHSPPGLSLLLPNLVHSFLGWIKPEADHNPHHQESLIFKTITVMLMGLLPNDMRQLREPIDELVKKQGLDEVILHLIENLTRKPDRHLSINLQSSLIRFMRQVLNISDDFVDNLLEKLDIDCTVAHITPYDRLKQMDEHDSARDKLASYCKQDCLRLILTKLCRDPNHPIGSMFRNITLYSEFAPVGTKATFLPKISNNTRSIELMAFVSKYCSSLKLNSGIQLSSSSTSENLDSKLEYLTQFITSLPDCDIKCLALLFAGKLLASELEVRLVADADFRLPSIERFSRIIDEMTDGDHSLTIRETCSHVLHLILKKIVKCCNTDFKHLCLMNLFSALIKLSQDEEREIRESSQLVIVSLRDCVSGASNTSNSFDQLVVGSRLNHLIRLIATELFDSNSEHDVNNCFELLMRIIFNHAKNYSNDLNEEKERLFDKTKLNTFADHVATIQSALEGLQLFFKKQDTSDQIHLNSLRFPPEILAELTVVDCPTDDNTGDYSWRLKKVAEGLPSQEATKSGEYEDNNLVVARFLENLEKSLDYFSKGYWNMLTDTEYTYRELSLFKRIAFMKFVLSCTRHELENERLISVIRERLTTIATSSCCTTLLYKCYRLMMF